MGFGSRVRTRILLGTAILALLGVAFGCYWKYHIAKMKMALPELQTQAFLDCFRGVYAKHAYYLFVQRPDDLQYDSPSDHVLSNVKTKFPFVKGLSKDSQRLRSKSDIYRLISKGPLADSSVCILSVTPHLWKGEVQLNCTLYSGALSGGEYEYRAKWSGDAWVLGFPTAFGIH